MAFATLTAFKLTKYLMSVTTSLVIKPTVLYVLLDRVSTLLVSTFWVVMELNLSSVRVISEIENQEMKKYLWQLTFRPLRSKEVFFLLLI